MKKIILLVVTLLLVLVIYFKNIDNKTYYLALGDSFALGVNPYNAYDYGYTDYLKDYLLQNNKLEKYINQFANIGYRTIDLTRDIKDNKMIVIDDEKVYLKQALIKADLVTVSIGTNDIINTLNFSVDQEYLDEIFNDIDNLLKTLRSYCKEKIIVVGYFSVSPNEIYDYANLKYKELCEKYEIIYIDIYDSLRGNAYFPNPNNIHPSKDGYKLISDKIIANL